MAKKQVQKTRVKKKRWFPIIAPRLFNDVVIGEIPLVESEPMIGRSITANLMNLTGNPKKQHSNIVLRINKVEGGKGLTEITGYKIMPSSVKRLVRRGRSKVDDSIVVATKDNKKVRIKPLILTRTNVNNSVTNSLRIRVRNAIAIFASKITYDVLVNEILNYRLQKHIDEVAKKICPIRSPEIRAFSLVEKEGVKPIKPIQEKDFNKKSSKKQIDVEAEADETKEDNNNTETEEEMIESEDFESAEPVSKKQKTEASEEDDEDDQADEEDESEIKE